VAVDEHSGPLGTLGGALYTADYLLFLLSHPYEYSTHWNLGLFEPYNYYGLIKIPDDPSSETYIARPNYYALQMFTRHFGQRLVETEIHSSGFSVPSISGGFYTFPAETEVPSIRAAASLGEGSLFLMLLNRETAQNVNVSVNVKNFTPQGDTRIWVLSGDALNTTNEENPHNVFIRKSDGQFVAPYVYVAPKHSLTVIEIKAAEKN
jgi:alpha-L-arabinofuranosidase